MNSGVNEIIVDQQKKSTELFGLKEPFFLKKIKNRKTP